MIGPKNPILNLPDCVRTHDSVHRMNSQTIIQRIFHTVLKFLGIPLHAFTTSSESLRKIYQNGPLNFPYLVELVLTG